MWKWPWVTTILAAMFALSPPGSDLIYNSFYSGELLAREIGQFLLGCFVIGFILLAVIEVLVNMLVRRRRARQNASGRP